MKLKSRLAKGDGANQSRIYQDSQDLICYVYCYVTLESTQSRRY
jgi:hypothetical protein